MTDDDPFHESDLEGRLEMAALLISTKNALRLTRSAAAAFERCRPRVEGFNNAALAAQLLEQAMEVLERGST